MKRVLRVDQLTVRIVVGMLLLVVAPLTVSLYILSHQHTNHTIETRRQAAESQGRLLEATLRHQMLNKDRELLTTLLEELGSQPEVQNAMILDHSGEIRFSSQAEMVGESILRDSPTCLTCHSKKPEERDRWVVLHGETGEVLRTVLPIQNRLECHACHDPKQRLNGIFILDTSLADVYAQLRRDRTWIMGGTTALALILLTGVGLVIRRLVLVRLGRLGRTARSITSGDLTRRADVDGSDVIAFLANDINDMASSVERLITEVREQEAQLLSVMNSLDDGLVVLDREFRVVAANRSFCRRFGSHPEVLRGHRCSEVIRDEWPSGASDPEVPAAKCLSTGEVQRAVLEISSGNEDPVAVTEVYTSPVFDENGSVVQVVEIWRDITERVREEERLAEIERLASLGVLASGFSHEVNTPLASMLTSAESVLSQIDNPSPQGSVETLLPTIRESADIIRRQVMRCRKITDQFLRFSRGIPPSIEPLDLRDVVTSVVSLVNPTAQEARATIQIQGESSVPAVKANTEVVQHVILNLLVNAVQSLDDQGGTITVRFLINGDVRIQVTDTGCGIALEARKHLFEPFRSRKPQGTGLGLFLSRSFMRRFGGDVRLVESHAEGGSCFEIIFPQAVVEGS